MGRGQPPPTSVPSWRTNENPIDPEEHPEIPGLSRTASVAFFANKHLFRPQKPCGADNGTARSNRHPGFPPPPVTKLRVLTWVDVSSRSTYNLGSTCWTCMRSTAATASRIPTRKPTRSVRSWRIRISTCPTTTPPSARFLWRAVALFGRMQSGPSGALSPWDQCRRPTSTFRPLARTMDVYETFYFPPTLRGTPS